MLTGQYTSLTAAPWHHLYPRAILDEVQKKPILIESIKAVYDGYHDLLPSFILEPDYAEREEAFRYYLKFGGHPALINTTLSDDERTEWLSAYVRTYLERDVRDLANFRYLEPFVKIQKMTSLLTGELLNYSDLAREAGVTAATVKKFISYLDMSYQTIQLQPWTRNKLKRLTKSPKQIRNAGLPVTVYHLRTVDGREIDLLLETEKDILPSR